MDSLTVTFLMEDLLLNLQVPQTPRIVVTADKRMCIFCIWCVAFHRTCLRTLPGRSQKSPRRVPGHSRHSFSVSLNICHRLVAMATGKRQQLMKPLVCFFACFTTSLRLISYLSRLQSFTDPSAAHDARLTSEWSREIPASGRKTTAPTLVLCPAGEQEEAR